MTHESPFIAPENRLSRKFDEEFSTYMAGAKVAIRLLGPRRTGKTEEVCWYARANKVPLIRVTVKPLAADVVNPAPIIAGFLWREIAALKTSAPSLHSAYEKIADGARRTTKKIGGEFTGVPGLKLSLELSKGTEAEKQPETDSDILLTSMLRNLELAAERRRVRPIVFFDELQELILHSLERGRATVWAIRNEVQHHTYCRYVFAGSNQRLFSKLQDGRDAPLLHFGSSIEIAPLTIEETDAWVRPLFEGGGRHIGSIENAATLLCGKIGEIVAVCNWLWGNTKSGAWIDEKMQMRAVLRTAINTDAETKVQTLTAAQAAVLRWVLANPGSAPFGSNGPRAIVNPGTIKVSLNRLMDLELVESFSAGRFSCTTPLRILAALDPEALELSDGSHKPTEGAH